MNYEYNKFFETKASEKAHRLMDAGRIVPNNVLRSVREEAHKAYIKFRKDVMDIGAEQFYIELSNTVEEVLEHNRIVKAILYKTKKDGT